MTSRFAYLSKHLARAMAVVVVAVGASACSSIPNWVDPTNWIGGSDDQTPAPDQSAQTADNGQTPDLSTIPEKPNAPSTADEQQKVAESLASDRARAQYSSETLKGGTEPSAAPPQAEAEPSAEEVASNETPPPATPAANPSPPPTRSSTPGTLPSENPAPSEAQPSRPSTATTQVASAEIPPPAMPQSALPAVPAVPALAANPVSPTDASLGFRPSAAPPLDPSVAQFVPASILARYKQTAAMGPQPAVPVATASSDANVVASNLVTSATKTRARNRMTGMGGPESMSGAVVANFDSLQPGGATMRATEASFAGGPAAVVYFPNDTTVLNVEARDQVRAAAKAYMAQGGQGFVRVIGHSSSRAGRMTAARHLVWNFERSQARASAVARLLIEAGVPADRVLIQAVGDEDPADAGSAAEGADGNRRAEIFFQS